MFERRRRRRRGEKKSTRTSRNTGERRYMAGFEARFSWRPGLHFIAPSQACVNPILQFPRRPPLRLHQHQHLHCICICVCVLVRIVGTGTHFHCERRISGFGSGRMGFLVQISSKNDADKNCDGLVERPSRMQWMRDKCRDCSHYLAEYEYCARGTGLWQFDHSCDDFSTGWPFWSAFWIGSARCVSCSLHLRGRIFAQRLCLIRPWAGMLHCWKVLPSLLPGKGARAACVKIWRVDEPDLQWPFLLLSRAMR